MCHLFLIDYVLVNLLFYYSLIIGLQIIHNLFVCRFGTVLSEVVLTFADEVYAEFVDLVFQLECSFVSCEVVFDWWIVLTPSHDGCHVWV